MQYYLEPCLHCLGRGRIEILPQNEAWGECEVCGIRTKSVTGATLESAIAEIIGIWNRKDAVQPPTCDEDFAKLVGEAVGPEDGDEILSLLARTKDDWPVRGPMLAAMAAQVATCRLARRDYWPVDTVLRHAERFLKLLPLRTWVEGSRVDQLTFGPIATIKREDFALDDNEIFRAIDKLPAESIVGGLDW